MKNLVEPLRPSRISKTMPIWQSVWHKQCFKCQVCNMTLNMRNYKGFNKQPYCEAHIPKAKATTVAETPELKRIAENTKLQSNVFCMYEVSAPTIM
ncbi:LIM and SH3 domain protein 1 [Homalodisca vitripennis]|nr:LIM and SH3 domain protein 1 [Homalodisca vitripennis]